MQLKNYGNQSRTASIKSGDSSQGMDFVTLSNDDVRKWSSTEDIATGNDNKTLQQHRYERNEVSPDRYSVMYARYS